MRTFDVDLIDERLRAARKFVAGFAAAGILSVGLVGGAAAQDLAASGNGGTSDSSASGGAVSVGDTGTGEESGSVIGAAIEAVFAGAFGDEAAAEGEGEGEEAAEDEGATATDDSTTATTVTAE